MNSYTVRPYTPHNWAHIAPLVDAWPFKALAGHADWQPARLKNLTYERFKNVLGNQDGAAWMALQENAVRGFAVFSMLAWDSEQLGISAARLDHLVATGSYAEQHQIKETLLGKVLDEAQRRGVWQLSARVDASDLSELHVLEEAGFITVDSILTFAKELARHKSSPLTYDFQIRLATSDDAERTANLARHAYIYDRFHSDPFIKPERADELHATWLRNSCAGKAADAVLLAEDEEGLLGFVTCKLQRDTGTHLGRMVGTIVLVATAERARGMGVGYATTMAALEWFRGQGTAVVEVGTQLRNIAASRLYQKCGFTHVGSSVSLRRLL
jgi:dTDP-4-amino-4,6-dideoxy-D-galactose acyltransferase